jgi:sugar-specific transcriptional regulator TrmB
MVKGQQNREPNYDVKKFTSAEEIDDAIKKIERRLNKLKQFQQTRINHASPEISSEDGRIRDAVMSVFGPNSSQFARFKDFRIDTRFIFSPHTPESELQSDFEDALQKALANVQSLLEELQEERQDFKPSQTGGAQGYFNKVQNYDAIKVVSAIIDKSQKSIEIVDSYIGEEVLNLLEGKNSAVEVRILTDQVSPNLLVKAAAFDKQHGRLAIRSSRVFHDRFMIIDDKHFYHFGASIKDLGNKAFMYTQITEPLIINLLQQALLVEWNRQES